MATSAISLTLSPYQSEAATSINQVLGTQARQTIRKGTVIATRMITAAATVRQVVVHAPDGLPAFHLISIDDITIEQRLAVSGIYTDTALLVGRYTLRPLPRGSVIRLGDVRAVTLAPNALGERRVVIIPIHDLAALESVAVGGPVSFLLQPHQPSPSDPPITIRDAIVIDVLRRDVLPALVVALTLEEFDRATPLLGRSEAVIFYTIAAP